MPDSRSIPAGTIRFWYDVWDDLAQLTGGSDQGILNPHIVPPRWEIYMAPDPTLSILWMQVLGVDAVIVSDKTSTQTYKDYLFPDKFRGELPILYDNGRGDRFFGVPRRFPGIARVVNRAEHDALPEIPNNGELNALRAWHHNVEAGPNSPAVLNGAAPIGLSSRLRFNQVSQYGLPKALTRTGEPLPGMAARSHQRRQTRVYDRSRTSQGTSRFSSNSQCRCPAESAGSLR